MKEMTESNYKKRLSEIYQDNVTLVSRFVNFNTTAVFACKRCGVTFYNRTSYMIGTAEGRHHLCDERYASTNTNIRKGVSRSTRKNRG